MMQNKKKCSKVSKLDNLMKFLTKWRAEKGLSLNQMARLTGVNPQTLHNLETKATDIRASTLVAIVRGIGLDWTLVGKELEKELKKEPER